MKKKYLELIIALCMVVVAIGGIRKCQERADAEASAEAAASQTEQATEAVADSTGNAEMEAYFERIYFDALAKNADEGKLYAIDAEGKRSPQAFKNYDDFSKFISGNPQYLRSHFSYDVQGRSFNVEAKPTSNQKPD
ncbi:MAG: hypothetical protein J5658_13165 [Prevotella sp.]|nr:hypothetical protein [Prevotella sp.]